MVYRQTDRQTVKTDRQTETDRQTDGHIVKTDSDDRQTDMSRQTERNMQQRISSYRSLRMMTLACLAWTAVNIRKVL